MEELSRPVWHDQLPARNAAVEAGLASLMAVHGAALFAQQDRLGRLLTEAAPDASRHIEVVIVALDAEVPQRASHAKSDGALAGSLHAWVRDLQEHASLDAAWATWAVAVWAHALGLPTIALGVVMDADTFPPPTRHPATAPSRRGHDGRGGAIQQAAEAAFVNGRAEPGLGRPANDVRMASANLIDPLFPEQRSRAAAAAAAPGIEPAPSSRSPEVPIDAARRDAVAASVPRNAWTVRQVIGGIVLVTIGVLIGFAVSAAFRHAVPVAPTSRTQGEWHRASCPPVGAISRTSGCVLTTWRR